MVKKHSHILLFAFVLAGLAVSLWSLANHYKTSGSSACNVNRTFNCDVVNKGEYSEIMGIPVAGIGVAGFVVLGLIAIFWAKERDPFMLKAFVGVAIMGLIFSLYLAYIEAFVLYTWCLLCLASLSCIAGATLTGVLERQKA